MTSSLKPHLLQELMPMVIGDIFKPQQGWFEWPPSRFSDSNLPKHLSMFNFFFAGKETFKLFVRFVSNKLFISFREGESGLYPQPLYGKDFTCCHRILCPSLVMSVLLRFVVVLRVDETVHDPENPMDIAFLELYEGFDNVQSVVNSWKLVRTLDSRVTLYEKLHDFANTSTNNRVLEKLDRVILRGTAAEFAKAFSKRNLRPLPTTVELHFVDSSVASIRSSITSLDTFEVELIQIYQNDTTFFGRPQMYATASIVKGFTQLSTFRMKTTIWMVANLSNIDSVTQISDAFLQSDFGPDREVEMTINHYFANAGRSQEYFDAFIFKMMNLGFFTHFSVSCETDCEDLFEEWIHITSVPGKTLTQKFVICHRERDCKI